MERTGKQKFASSGASLSRLGRLLADEHRTATSLIPLPSEVKR